MKLHSNANSRRWWQRILLLSLLVISLMATGSCSTDQHAKGKDYILALEQDGKLEGRVDLENKILVYPQDTSELLASIRSAPTLPDKKDVIADYLRIQRRLDCILEKIEDSVREDVNVSCEGKIMVETEDKHGILGVHELWEALQQREGQLAKREYLRGYMKQWKDTKRVSRVVESLGQMERTRGIPVFGTLVRSIHQFPIMFEGDEIVPKSDVPSLLDQFGSLNTEDAMRDLAEGYLNQ